MALPRMDTGVTPFPDLTLMQCLSIQGELTTINALQSGAFE